ncbi:MAG: AfsR/SARP family transcriptional regulator [Candidatus Limnocylindrales bacterium]
MSAARIQVHLLGPVTIQIDGSPLAVDTRKAIALLAFLVATRRPASREAVAALLWPEADGPDARGALRRTLSVLKAGLGDPGLIVDRSAVVLDTLACCRRAASTATNGSWRPWWSWLRPAV